MKKVYVDAFWQAMFQKAAADLDAIFQNHANKPVDEDPLVKCLDDYAVSIEARRQALADCEREAGTFSMRIGWERVWFKNWHIVKIYYFNLKFRYERSATGRKIFKHNERVIAADKVPAAIYAAREKWDAYDEGVSK